MDFINVKEDKTMKKTTLDKNILLGGVMIDNPKYQVVHMNLKKGNQTDAYSIEKNVLLINISGNLTVATEEVVENLKEFEVLEIAKGESHVITCLEDSQVIAIKI